jgi:hypothetical protein
MSRWKRQWTGRQGLRRCCECARQSLLSCPGRPASIRAKWLGRTRSYCWNSLCTSGWQRQTGCCSASEGAPLGGGQIWPQEHYHAPGREPTLACCLAWALRMAEGGHSSSCMGAGRGAGYRQQFRANQASRMRLLTLLTGRPGFVSCLVCAPATMLSAGRASVRPARKRSTSSTGICGCGCSICWGCRCRGAGAVPPHWPLRANCDSGCEWV